MSTKYSLRTLWRISARVWTEKKSKDRLRAWVRIEKVLKRDGKKGLALVKWKGYDDSFNSWVPLRDTLGVWTCSAWNVPQAGMKPHEPVRFPLFVSREQFDKVLTQTWLAGTPRQLGAWRHEEEHCCDSLSGKQLRALYFSFATLLSFRFAFLLFQLHAEEG